MSTTSFLLLSLLCLVVTHSDAYLGWRTDGSALVAKSFIVVFRNAIENEYAEELEEIIADDIFFIDCSMKYNKTELVDMLLQSSSNFGLLSQSPSKFEIKFQSSHYLTYGKIRFYVIASKLGGSTTLYIDSTSGRWQLVTGYVTSCPESYVYTNSTDS